MPSFQISLSPSRRAAGRFVGQVRRKLQEALASSDMSQSEIADALGVNRSVISRQFRGMADMSIGRVAELGSCLGYEPVFELRKAVVIDRDNAPPPLTFRSRSNSTQGKAVIAPKVLV